MSLGGPAAAEGAFEKDRRQRRRTPWWAALLAIGILVGAVALAKKGPPKAPPLAASCSTSKLVLSDATVKHNAPVSWAASGPAGTRFVIRIGVESLEPTGTPNVLRAVADPGLTAAQLEQATPDETMPAGCKKTGSFVVKVPVGRTYNVRMFAVTGTGLSVAARPVATVRLTVK